MPLQRSPEDEVVAATVFDNAEDCGETIPTFEDREPAASDAAASKVAAAFVVDLEAVVANAEAATAEAEAAENNQHVTAAMDNNANPKTRKEQRQRRAGRVIPAPIPTLEQEMAVAGDTLLVHDNTDDDTMRKNHENVVVVSRKSNSSGKEKATNNNNKNNNKMNSKHDEKWNEMFQLLIDYKRHHGDSTMVPQCYPEDPRLGRWVHYQRVEYWIYQSTGSAKISADRIRRLEEIGMVWDPQRAIWNAMFVKLQHFVTAHGHCRVPKGYAEDLELANWVRNQRLEYANQLKGKNSRMTRERLELLNAVGFTWSTAMPSKSKAAKKELLTTATTDDDACVPPPFSVNSKNPGPLPSHGNIDGSSSSSSSSNNNELPQTNGDADSAMAV